MNERIQELAFELAEQYDWNPPHEPTHYTFAAEDLEKFAELIVRECAGIYSRIDNGNPHMGTEDYLEALVRHFGEKR